MGIDVANKPVELCRATPEHVTDDGGGQCGAPGGRRTGGRRVCTSALVAVLIALVMVGCKSGSSDGTSDHRVQLWITTLNSHNVEVLAELFGTNGRYEVHMDLYPPLTGGSLRTYWSGFWRDFPDLVFVAKAVMVQGDRAALEWEAKGTHVSSGQPLLLSGVSVIEFRGDQVARVRDYYDATPFLPFLSPTKPQ